MIACFLFIKLWPRNQYICLPIFPFIHSKSHRKVNTNFWIIACRSIGWLHSLIMTSSVFFSFELGSSVGTYLHAIRECLAPHALLYMGLKFELGLPRGGQEKGGGS